MTAELAANDQTESDVHQPDRTESDFAGSTSLHSQYLTFQLLDQEYATDILRVQEIRNYSHITPIPNSPKHVKGAMNLRGTVVPIVDLREKFNLPTTDYTDFTVIIVVTIGDKVVGLVVDAVKDVLNISEDDCEPAPDLAGELDSSFISALAKQKERLVTILNIDRLVGPDAPQVDSANQS